MFILVPLNSFHQFNISFIFSKPAIFQTYSFIQTILSILIHPFKLSSFPHSFILSSSVLLPFILLSVLSFFISSIFVLLSVESSFHLFFILSSVLHPSYFHSFFILLFVLHPLLICPLLLYFLSTFNRHDPFFNTPHLSPPPPPC